MNWNDDFTLRNFILFNVLLDSCYFRYLFYPQCGMILCRKTVFKALITHGKENVLLHISCSVTNYLLMLMNVTLLSNPRHSTKKKNNNKKTQQETDYKPIFFTRRNCLYNVGLYIFGWDSDNTRFTQLLEFLSSHSVVLTFFHRKQ